MSTQVTIRKIGNSLGVILPAHVVDKLHVAEGDQLFVLDDSSMADTIRLSACDPKQEAILRGVEAGRRRHRHALAELSRR